MENEVMARCSKQQRRIKYAALLNQKPTPVQLTP